MVEHTVRKRPAALKITFDRLVDRLFGNDQTYASKHQPFDVVQRVQEKEFGNRVHIPDLDAVTFMIGSPAGDVELLDSDGSQLRLQELAGSTTVVLMVDATISTAPGFRHRVMRRAETLGSGVRLICVAESTEASGGFALVDSQQSLRSIAGGCKVPFMLSLDSRGKAFDLETDREAILNWLWNEPRPHSVNVSYRAEAESATG